MYTRYSEGWVNAFKGLGRSMPVWIDTRWLEGKTMPLVKSKSDKAVGKNIKAEQAAGKPRKQAIAIGLAWQRKLKGQKQRSK